MLTRRNIRQRMTNRETVFNNVVSLGDRLHGKLMPASHRLTQGYRLVINGDNFTFGQIRQRDGNVIQRMDFDVLHINLKRP